MARSACLCSTGACCPTCSARARGGGIGPLQAGGLSGPEVLAKHDENYMPPEAAHALKQAQPAKEQP
jgi:hypothetical protein